MGSLFRSEDMTLCQLFLQSEAAYACVSELGELGLVQFRDLNPDVNAFQRKFVNEVRRCDEMERKLRFLEKEIRKDGIPMLDTGDNPDAPQPREMIDLEATFEKLESEMNDVNANSEALKKNFLELTELKHILRKTQAFFDESGVFKDYEADHHTMQAMHDPLIPDDDVQLLGEELGRHAGQALKLGYTDIQHGEINVFVAGVILRERIPAFERMLWRVCRGNVFLKQAEIDTRLEDPITGDRVDKTVFIIFFQGEQLKSRVKKICEGFRATLYPCPETQSDRREMSIGVMTRIEDLNTVLGQTQDHRHRLLVAAAKNIKVWFIKVRKIKAIYHTLNMFNLDVTQKCLISECWCPVADLDRIQQALKRGNERSGSSVPSILNRMSTRQEPPTYHRLNKFTVVFQNIVDAYGVASYREVNPAPWTIISFPFLFAIMFGDAGHGVIMLLFALYLVIMEKRLAPKMSADEIFGMFFNGRYIILLMGAFSIYTGLIYNDIFSKSLNIFGSAWKPDPSVYNTSSMDLKNYKINANNTVERPYPFGLDPVWQLAINKITITNSLKMKISVIFGVCHMLFGLSLSLLNHRFFNKPLNVYFEFIPQLIFMCSIFGYLILLIFVKWLKFGPADTGKAPNLLIGLISMFLFQYEDPCKPTTCWYAGQKGFQITLVVVAVLCVPWMLLVKPYMLRKQHLEGKLSVNSGDLLNSEVEGDDGTLDQTGLVRPTPQIGEDVCEIDLSTSRYNVHIDSVEKLMKVKPFDFSEVMITQAIHTIEYCLGCVSHTASYLRLWALSLAHAQLSEVLWTMVMTTALSFKIQWLSVIFIFVCFAFWACCSIVILVLMEGMSAFLHALRLHWVEFQSKFYKGEGYQFVPFSFDTMLAEYGLAD
ncbi:V-type proton ATPase 116 kDa subunit a 1-like isoform X1 [Dreissena polymorpha]|uniref:V-type proton ATPase 116 kDa subunit a 1-like isoform X1 n=1 Tax=Dreissena polymorpha TaxID=45954 RepID=UPI0022642177|nr:V-type proton ATPase 116 kDa subunit a 1-like isoform X1 [Dreissena polymorpha]